MIVKNAIFGNPWHGKLSTGSIELDPGTPVTSITVDGVEHTVETVTGNLGNTRYLKAPGLAEPTTPTEIAALDGEFMNDAVLFSEEYRYSPLAVDQVIDNPYKWLLFDGTAQKWRRMHFGHTFYTLSTNPESPSAAGSDCVEIRFERDDNPFGHFDRLSGDDTVDTTTFIEAFDLPLTYAYTPLTRPSSYPYNPTTRSISIAPSPNGRKILVRLEAERWNPYTISDTVAIEGPLDVYDDSHTWIFNVWEVSFNDDGTVASTPVQVWPDLPNVDDPESWVELQLLSEGDVYWDYEYVPSGTPPFYRALYYVPCTFRDSRNIIPGYSLIGYETSIIVNADYDKDANIRISFFRMASYPYGDMERTANGYIGQYSQNSEFDPADHIPSYTLSTSTFRHDPASPVDYYAIDYPDADFADFVTVSTTVFENAICGVYEDDTALKTWDTEPPGTLSWRWKTNNVTELYTGTTSHLRIGPGDVDDSALTTSDYASFNPRAGVVVSSESPIGFV